MKPLLALLLLTSVSFAREVNVPKAYDQSGWHVPTQCGPGGCQPPGGFFYSEPMYGGSGPQPDGIETPPVGSPGTPEFKPCPPNNTPPPLVPPKLDPPAVPAVPAVPPAADDKTLILLGEIKIAIEKQKGCECKPCDLSPVIAKLDALALAVGGIPTTPPGTPSPQPSEGEQHVVIVADQNAPYWQRLSEQITRTKQTYHGIQLAGLPKFPLGTHPQAVVYKNSVPTRIVKGQYEVEALLSRLARGEAI